MTKTIKAFGLPAVTTLSEIKIIFSVFEPVRRGCTLGKPVPSVARTVAAPGYKILTKQLLTFDHSSPSISTNLDITFCQAPGRTGERAGARSCLTPAAGRRASGTETDSRRPFEAPEGVARKKARRHTRRGAQIFLYRDAYTSPKKQNRYQKISKHSIPYLKTDCSSEPKCILKPSLKIGNPQSKTSLSIVRNR